MVGLSGAARIRPGRITPGAVVLLLVHVGVVTSPAFAGGRMSHATIARLSSNCEAFLAEHPTDCDAQLSLAKLNAFALPQNWVSFNHDLHAPAGSGYRLPIPEPARGPATKTDRALGYRSAPDAEWFPSMTERMAHGRRARELFDSASACDSVDRPTLHLARGWFFEQGAHAAHLLVRDDRAVDAAGRMARMSEIDRLRAAGTPFLPPLTGASRWLDEHEGALGVRLLDTDPAVSAWCRRTLEDAWVAVAAEQYVATIDAALAVPRPAASPESRPPLAAVAGAHAIAVEALGYGGGLIRRIGVERASELEARLARFAEPLSEMWTWIGANTPKPRSTIKSPLVFAVDGRGLDEMLADAHQASFDMTGSGAATCWSWLGGRPCFPVIAEFVRDGTITGEALLGEHSFGLEWRDGFAALAMLDDDRNGVVEARELSGLAIWVDGGERGRLEDGELVTPQSLGVDGFVWRFGVESVLGGHLSIRDGVRRSGDANVALYDWFARSVDTGAVGAVTKRRAVRSSR